MNVERALLPTLLALAVAQLALAGAGWTLPAGAPATPPRASPGAVATEVVRLRELVPRDVELGDRVAILGEGYPTGKSARISFRGTLHRPGVRALSGVEIVLEGEVANSERIEVLFGDDVMARFCDSGDRATHTTFEGDVEVAFPSAVAGAPPSAALAEHITLDVRPSFGPATASREREGERVLAWVGLHAVSRPSGLAIERVDPGSRAEAAGIAAGDRLETFDGVRVATIGDVVPPPGERSADVGVRGGRGDVSRSLVLAMDGLRRAPLAELLGAALSVIVALVVVVLFGAPAPPATAAAMQRFVSRLRERRTAELAARQVRREPRTVHRPGVLADVVAYGLVAALPFGPCLVVARLDVLLLFFVAAAALATAPLLGQGSRWDRARAAVRVLVQHVPAAAAVASVVVMTGSLRIQEIARAQGGWPWDWAAFRSPAALALVVVLLTCGLAEPDVRSAAPRHHARHHAPTDARGRPRVADLLEAACVFTSPRPPWLEAICRAHRVVMAGLASLLFLGGWLVPGMPARWDAHPALVVAGAACLLGKTWILAAAMGWIRGVLPGAAGASAPSIALWLAPLSAGSLGAVVVWTWWAPPPAAQLLVSGSLLAGSALFAAALLQRVRRGLASAGSEGRLSPFL